MVYGVINERGEKLYTYLSKLFESIDNAQLDYNWLITDAFCNIPSRVDEDIADHGYCWLSGDALTKLVKEKQMQWIFAVLSGFKKDIPLQDILEYPFPLSNYAGFWYNPISMQHPLATIEIVPWDASLTLFFSTDADLATKFKKGYPQSEDLTVYNARFEK